MIRPTTRSRMGMYAADRGKPRAEKTEKTFKRRVGFPITDDRQAGTASPAKIEMTQDV